MLDIQAIKFACTDDTIVLTDHAKERMKERNIKTQSGTCENLFY